MWFYLMMHGYQHRLCHIRLHTNVALRHVELRSTYVKIVTFHIKVIFLSQWQPKVTIAK